MANIKRFKDYINENYDGEQIHYDEMYDAPSLDVRPGDLVDFGPYGKNYVLAISGRNFWITDNEADRFTPDAEGWFVSQSSARGVIQSGEMASHGEDEDEFDSFNEGFGDYGDDPFENDMQRDFHEEQLEYERRDLDREQDYGFSEQAEFEEEVMYAMCDAEDLTFSDAQGILDAQQFTFMQCYNQGMTAEETATEVLRKSLSN